MLDHCKKIKKRHFDDLAGVAAILTDQISAVRKIFNQPPTGCLSWRVSDDRGEGRGVGG